MGCDIHMRVETRPTAISSWEPAKVEGYGGRNYSLFAMLAGVRNGTGFAGTDMGDPVVPISEPRGLPTDVCAEVKKESDYWGIDGHSHSWFTLDELLAVPWSENNMTHRVQIRRRKNAPPLGNWQDDLNDPDKFAERIEQIANDIGELPWSYGWEFEACGWSSEGYAGGWRGIEYTSTWADAAGPGWLTFLLDLYRLVDDPRYVRVVFWFYN